MKKFSGAKDKTVPYCGNCLTYTQHFGQNQNHPHFLTMSGMNCPKQNLPANNLKNKVFKTYPQNRDTLNIKIFLYFKF